jgi:hypothetical protein
MLNFGYPSVYPEKLCTTRTPLPWRLALDDELNVGTPTDLELRWGLVRGLPADGQRWAGW